jgi:hypothetical protein
LTDPADRPPPAPPRVRGLPSADQRPRGKEPGRNTYRPTIPKREKSGRSAIAPRSPSLRPGATPAGMGPSRGDSRRGGRPNRRGRSQRRCALRCDRPKHPGSHFAARYHPTFTGVRDVPGSGGSSGPDPSTRRAEAGRRRDRTAPIRPVPSPTRGRPLGGRRSGLRPRAGTDRSARSPARAGPDNGSVPDRCRRRLRPRPGPSRPAFDRMQPEREPFSPSATAGKPIQPTEGRRRPRGAHRCWINRRIREVPHAGRQTPDRASRRPEGPDRPPGAEGFGERPGPASGRRRGTTSWARSPAQTRASGGGSRPSRCPGRENSSHPRFRGPKPHLGDRIQLDARFESEEEPGSLNAGSLACSESVTPSSR